MDRRLVGYFSALFMPAAALVAVATGFAYRSQVDLRLHEVELRETLDTQRGVEMLSRNLAAYSRDILFVKSLPSVGVALKADGPAPVERMQQMFVAAATAQGEVDQVRWIDETGHEKVRINSLLDGPRIATAAELQDKSDRYYVVAIARLRENEVYVSPLDLNVEHGAVELPWKPTLRVGTPLFRTDGSRAGMLLFNYRTERMLDEFEAGSRGVLGSSTLLNEAGYELRSANPADDWGFMFGRKERFATRHPGAWRRMQSTEQGQFTDEAGLWTYETMRPQAVVDAAAAALYRRSALTPQPAQQTGETWKVVSHVDAAELEQLVRPVRLLHAGVATLLLVCGAALSALLARAWRRRDLQALEDSVREARESTASLRLVLQSNPNAMLIVDQHGKVTDANPSAEHIFGYGTDAMSGLAVEQLVPTRSRAGHVAQRDAYFATPHARPMGADIDLAAVRRDGNEFPVEISLAPLNLRGVPYVVATVVDISARRQAEATIREMNATLERRVAERTHELQLAEANLRLLLESSASGMFGVDGAGCVTFANPAACRILGTEATALVGMQAGRLVEHPGRAAGTDPFLQRTLRDGEPQEADDATFRDGAGRSVPVLYSAHPMVRDGALVGAVVSFLDVTERRRLDEAREAALYAAQRLAQARSDFLANMSHEIRTPLNGMLGLAQVGYRDTGDSTEAHAKFGQILESGRTLLGIVDNVIDFSRIEAGKIHIDAQPVELRSLLDQVVAAVAPSAAEHGLRFGVTIAPDVPARVVTDAMRVRQVLLNLLSNAVKFTRQGEVSLTVDRQGEWLRFTVRDTGIGIGEDQLARIFPAFVQGDTSSTRCFGGLGLGLAISKRITDLMQGRIDVKSRIGSGSEFIVMLPLVEPHGTTGVAPAGSASASTAGPRLAGMRILLAEDNEVNQMVVQAMLGKEGPEVVTVGDGLLAVEAVRREGPDAFDIVLMDIQMPGMDGYEATRLIHGLAPDLPVIGQTAHVLQEAIEQCRAAGMVAHLPKPIDRHDLIATILQHARPRKRAAAAQGPTP